MLSDLGNIEKVRDPHSGRQDKGFPFRPRHHRGDRPSGRRTAPADSGTRRTEVHKFATEQSPIPFDLWIQVLPVTDATSKMKLTIKAELNPFIKGMVQGPLKEGVEKIADALAAIRYE